MVLKPCFLSADSYLTLILLKWTMLGSLIGASPWAEVSHLHIHNNTNYTIALLNSSTKAGNLRRGCGVSALYIHTSDPAAYNTWATTRTHTRIHAHVHRLMVTDEWAYHHFECDWLASSLWRKYIPETETAPRKRTRTPRTLARAIKIRIAHHGAHPLKKRKKQPNARTHHRQ